MTEKDVNRRCAEIADEVIPDFRVTRQSHCTGIRAKKWNAAYEGAHIALTGKKSDPPMSVNHD